MLERRVSTRAFCRTADVWVVEVVVRCCGGPRVTYENVVLIEPLRERGGRERARDAPLEDDFTLNNSRRLAVQAPAPATLLRARPL